MASYELRGGDVVIPPLHFGVGAGAGAGSGPGPCQERMSKYETFCNYSGT